jgi:ketosteroid isomerase-like protein
MIVPLMLALAVSCAAPEEDVSEEIIALERAALDRWGKGDPQGYIELFAPEITYFDPFTERRVNGAEAMKAYLAPITGKVNVDRFDMIEPKVQRHGDVAVLSFNLLSYGPQNVVLARWNSTEVYGLIEGRWRIVHNHWSFTQPELKTPFQE